MIWEGLVTTSKMRSLFGSATLGFVVEAWYSAITV
jgi:hypothetical protein